MQGCGQDDRLPSPALQMRVGPHPFTGFQGRASSQMRMTLRMQEGHGGWASSMVGPFNGGMEVALKTEVPSE